MAYEEGSQSSRNYNTADLLKVSVIRAELLQRPKTVVGVLLGATIIFFSIGIWFFCVVTTLHSMTHEERYDQCIDEERGQSCSTFIPEPNLLKCSCILTFQLKTIIPGDVTLYYELESFDQTNTAYANSRDDAQLQGKPGRLPAQSCGNFSYYDDKPIFPCGEIADSMFNDTFLELTRTDVKPEITLPVLYTKLFNDDTPEFKNPPDHELNTFSMPKSWLRNASGDPYKPWEDNTELKGVENPAFRAWMATDLKRKPVWRIGDVGLPAGNYSLTINMFYGVDRYKGVRKIILEGVYSESGTRNVAAGIVFIILVICGFLLTGYYTYLLRNRKESTPNSKETVGTLPANDEKRTPLLNRIRNTLSEFRHK